MDAYPLVVRGQRAQLRDQAGAARVLAQHQHQHAVSAGGVPKRGDQVGHSLVAARVAEEQVDELRAADRQPCPRLLSGHGVGKYPQVVAVRDHPDRARRIVQRLDAVRGKPAMGDDVVRLAGDQGVDQPVQVRIAAFVREQVVYRPDKPIAEPAGMDHVLGKLGEAFARRIRVARLVEAGVEAVQPVEVQHVAGGARPLQPGAAESVVALGQLHAVTAQGGGQQGAVGIGSPELQTAALPEEHAARRDHGSGTRAGARPRAAAASRHRSVRPSTTTSNVTVSGAWPCTAAARRPGRAHG